MTGFALQTGQQDGPPTLPPFGLADGPAVITALYHRDTSEGQGQLIDLSLIEPLLGILGPGPSVYDQLGIILGRNGNRSQNSAPRSTYLTRYGRWVAVSSRATPVAARVMRLSTGGGNPAAHFRNSSRTFSYVRRTRIGAR